jgi:glycerol-3-phosphate dehydrogenase subunit C
LPRSRPRRQVAASLSPWINNGHDIVALVPSCALMLKFEWPLILPDDPAVKKLAAATFDISE